MLSHRVKYYKHSIRILWNKLNSKQYITKDKYSAITVEMSGVCNLNCEFCAYKDKDEGKVIMSNDDFFDNINQLADLDQEYIALKPLMGDIFIDKHFSDKIDFLERHPKIKGYEFITNLITASEDALSQLSNAKKLTRMTISFYGHSLASFRKVTNRPASQYHRLIKNVNYLASISDKFQAKLAGCIKTDQKFNWTPHDKPGADENDLQRSVRKLAQQNGDFYWSGNEGDLDSWSGRITQADMDELDMGFKIVGPSVPMIGPCALLFAGPVIMADGRVNACACRAEKGLIIGDVKKSPLYEILSPENPLFEDLLARHKKNDYPKECINCKIFMSIYRKPHKRSTITTDEYLDERRGQCERARLKSHMNKS